LRRNEHCTPILLNHGHHHLQLLTDVHIERVVLDIDSAVAR
jgi:hypothetical protein